MFKSYNQSLGSGQELLTGEFAISDESEPVEVGHGTYVVRVKVNSIHVEQSGEYEYEDNEYEAETPNQHYRLHVVANTDAAPNTWNEISPVIDLGSTAVLADHEDSEAGEIHHLVFINPNNKDIKLVLTVEGDEALIDLDATLHSKDFLP